MSKNYQLWDDMNPSKAIGAGDFATELRLRASFNYWRRKLPADDPRVRWSLQKRGEYLFIVSGEPAPRKEPVHENQAQRLGFQLKHDIPIPPPEYDYDRLRQEELFPMFSLMRPETTCFEAPIGKAEAIRKLFRRWQDTLRNDSEYKKAKLVERRYDHSTSRFWLSFKKGAKP